MTNPFDGAPFVIERHAGVAVVRDDLLEGGSKLRFLPALIPEGTREVVFGGPCCGGAPLALSVFGRVARFKVSLFYAKRAALLPRQRRALANGAALFSVPMGFMTHVQAKARAYAAAEGALFLPLGFDRDAAQVPFVAAMHRAAAQLADAPEEIWCASGSGMLARCLGVAFPTARVVAVAVGLRSRWSAQAFPSNVEVRPCRLRFEQEERRPAPFSSCPNYDRKAWHACVADRAVPAARKLFWNVLGSEQP
jgi:hypothetical protein